MAVTVETFSNLGQSSSSTQAPLDLVLCHFQEFQNVTAVSAAQVKQGLQTLCALEWSTFQVVWPPERPFNLSLVLKVQSVVFSHPGHPDQVPYFVAWRYLLINAPYMAEASHFPSQSQGCSPGLPTSGGQKKKQQSSILFLSSSPQMDCR